MIKLLIAGDYCPKNRIANLIEKSDYESIFSHVKPIFEQVDFSIINLEAPIIEDDCVSPIKKAGPSLKCTKKVIDPLKYLKIGGVTLANNHLRDYGNTGVLTTIDNLKKANISYVGAGKNLSEAKITLYKDIKGIKVAIINCCEHEYSIARDNAAGSNPLNPIQQYYAIKAAKENVDFVIVIVHGGIEHFQLPSPRMVETYRFFIDVGADAVVNHHQHCFSGYEIHNGKPIFYGVGNFCFDWDGKRDSIWNEGYMVKLNLYKGSKIDFEIIPYEQCNEYPTIILKDIEESNKFYSQIQNLNRIILDSNKLDQEYEKYLAKTSRLYDVISIWDNRYLKALYTRGFIPSFISHKTLQSLYNKITCESHRDRLLYQLNKKLRN